MQKKRKKYLHIRKNKRTFVRFFQTMCFCLLKLINNWGIINEVADIVSALSATVFEDTVIFLIYNLLIN